MKSMELINFKHFILYLDMMYMNLLQHQNILWKICMNVYCTVYPTIVNLYELWSNPMNSILYLK